MRRLYSIIMLLAVCLSAGAFEINYEFAQASRYWTLGEGRTSVRLRQKPTTSSPMLKVHATESDQDYTVCKLFWEGDKSAKYKPFAAHGSDHKRAEVYTAYARENDLMPLVSTQGDWSKVIYTDGEWTSNSGVDSKQAWIMTKFGSIITPAPLGEKDLKEQYYGIKSRPNQHPDFRWIVAVYPDDQIYVEAPFILDGKYLIKCAVPVIFGPEMYYDGITWTFTEDGMYARVNNAEITYRTNEKDITKVVATLRRTFENYNHDQYEEMVKKTLEEGVVSVWVKDASTERYYRLSDGVGPQFSTYNRSGKITVK